jgi:hypothetical protein
MANETFKLTRDQMEHIFSCLRRIDHAVGEIEPRYAELAELCATIKKNCDGVYYLVDRELERLP